MLKYVDKNKKSMYSIKSSQQKELRDKSFCNVRLRTKKTFKENVKIC